MPGGTDASKAEQSTRHEMPALPAPLLNQPHPANDDAPVHRLAHVVDREQDHTAGGDGSPFHAGLAGAFGC